MDLTGWIEYFVRGLATQLLEVQERSTRAITAEQLGRAHNLNPRQIAVLDELLARGQTGIDDLAPAFPTVSRRTL